VDLRAAAIANQDQDWAEALQWFRESTFQPDPGPGSISRIYDLFCCEESEIRESATDQEIDMLQRLARVAFNDLWVRLFDAVADERSGT
jgi:hypothetical protein